MNRYLENKLYHHHFKNFKLLSVNEEPLIIDECVDPDSIKLKEVEVFEHGYELEFDFKAYEINHFLLDDYFGGRPENYSEWYGGA